MSNARLDRLSASGNFSVPRLEPGGTARLRFLRSRQSHPADLHDPMYARAQALDLLPSLVDAARAMAEQWGADTDARPATATSSDETQDPSRSPTEQGGPPPAADSSSPTEQGGSPPAADSSSPTEQGGPPPALRFDERERLALFRLLVVVLLDVRAGSTRTPVLGAEGDRHLRARLEPLLGYDDAPAALEAIQSLVQTKLATDEVGSVRPLVRNGDYVATDRLNALESRVVRAFAARLRRPASPSGGVTAALSDVQARPVQRDGKAQPLSEEQAQAVAFATGAQVSVISGGPGTGKTSIVLGLIRTLVRLGVSPGRVLVAAPTGKAAHRVSESLRRGLEQLADPGPKDAALAQALPVAETLHRLLAYSPRTQRFARDQDDPLAADVVIVDEASMIDLRLMDALLAGLPEQAQLVLLGDADQLPSVDAGAILRDLRGDHNSIQRAVQLTHSYRMDASDPRGANILAAAQAIQRGAVPDGPVQTRVNRLTYAGFELLQAEDTELRRRFLDAWFARHLGTKSYQRAARRLVLYRDGAFRADDVRAIESLMHRLNGFRLLGLTRTAALPTGAEAINMAVHERFVSLDPGPDEGPRPGEPVMMLRNDYERGLFNGDVGVVMNVAVDTQAAAPMMVFATTRGYEPFPQSLLQQDLTLAHAMTVHKAQGSEFDEVALILPDADVPILSREVLYTGLTRAKTGVIVVGAPALVARAAARPIERHSGLADGLRRTLEAPSPQSTDPDDQQGERETDGAGREPADPIGDDEKAPPA